MSADLSRPQRMISTLGYADVIASDKTGTLTKNEMTVRTVVTASGRVSLEGTGYLPVGDVRVDGGAMLEGTKALELLRGEGGREVPPKLLDQVKVALRLRHYSLRTEEWSALLTRTVQPLAASRLATAARRS